jgi:hypothetical protein
VAEEGADVAGDLLRGGGLDPVEPAGAEAAGEEEPGAAGGVILLPDRVKMKIPAETLAIL